LCGVVTYRNGNDLVGIAARQVDDCLTVGTVPASLTANVLHLRVLRVEPRTPLAARQR
jgi:hypothetical protein